METIKVIAELKKRGVKVPPKPAKQKIKEEADKKKESITTAKKLIQEIAKNSPVIPLFRSNSTLSMAIIKNNYTSILNLKLKKNI